MTWRTILGSMLILGSAPAWATVSSAPELDPAGLTTGLGLAAGVMWLLSEGRRKR